MYKIIKKKNCVFEYFQLGEHTEKIILFTDFKSSINRWNKQFIENLSKYFTVVCFNYPEIGQSKYEQIEKIEDYAKFAIDMLDLDGKDDFYFFGHSMGGYVVRSYLSLNNCPMPKAVIFNNTSPGGQKRVVLNRDIYHILNNEDSESPAYIKLMYGKNIGLDVLNESYLSRDVLNISKDVEKKQTELIMNFFKEESLYSQKISQPVCIIHGRNDQVFPLQNAYNFLPMCENITELHLTHGHHAHLTEYSDYIAKIIISFVQDLKKFNLKI
ncbi:alpha/beta fold hydrolase [Fluviispira vulneris]|uniref:alpha/beta fold hydrolase n=1 Tax=Fluviispira vulneris TaxID=2763012 RepID=UPI00164949E1|nr:alpha/beta hydrolase [Fluviispira vulneris]